MMHIYLQENKQTLKLAFPIIVSHLGQILLGITDTVMIGRVGTVELAAVALMNNLIHLFMVLGFGLAIAVSIQVSHAHGKNSVSQSIHSLRHGLVLSLLLGIGTWLSIQAGAPLLHYLKQPTEVLEIFPDYLVWIAPSLSLMMPIMVMKSYAEALNRPWTVFWIQFAGVLLNIILNALFIFGMFGFPEMGLAGAGLATFLARLITLLVMFMHLYIKKDFAHPENHSFSLREFKILFTLATPITAQMLMEFGAFAVSALLIGQLGSLPMAAHQIAMTCAVATYVIPMGLSSAVGIRVGHAMGADAADKCRNIIIGAQSLTVFTMGSFGIVYITMGPVIARAFTTEPELIALAVSLLSITGVFQLFDGIQVVSVGALRAMKDVKVPLILSVIGYWGIAFPFGGWMGFGLERGVVGFWTGLATGLGIAAFSMSLRLIWLLRRNVSHPNINLS